MSKKTSRNDDFLFACKNEILSPKVYDIIVDLVNEGKEKEAKSVANIDYLLDYLVTAIKARDRKEKEAKSVANIDYLLDYLVTAIKARDRFSIKETSERINMRFKELEKKGIEVPILKESFEKIIKTNKVKL